MIHTIIVTSIILCINLPKMKPTHSALCVSFLIYKSHSQGTICTIFDSHVVLDMRNEFLIRKMHVLVFKHNLKWMWRTFIWGHYEMNKIFHETQREFPANIYLLLELDKITKDLLIKPYSTHHCSDISVYNISFTVKFAF